ncbi:MAG TPA: dienelactone hydrolase family protein [Planctomycetota bacterium]|jgi:dienelactone hydrolase|nr:dienelactone hydrolase family protein [Planctomycetota bacterium]
MLQLLAALIACTGGSALAPLQDPPSPEAPASDASVPQTIEGKFTLTPLVGPTPRRGRVPASARRFLAKEIKAPFRRAVSDQADGIPFSLEPRDDLGPVRTFDLRFPSPAPVVEAEHPSATVVARYLCPAEPPEEPQPAILILHHLQDDQTLELVMGSWFAQRGFACLVLWFPGYGPRRGDEGKMVSADLEQLTRLLGQSVGDLHACRDWLAQRPEVDAERISLLGVSLGATLGSTMAGMDPGFAACVLVLGGGDLATVIFNGSRETSGMERLLNERGVDRDAASEVLTPIDPLTWAHRLPTDGVLMLNAKNDEIFPRDCTERLRAACPGEGPIHWYPGSHAGIALFLPDIMNRIDGFLRERLDLPAAPPR